MSKLSKILIAVAIVSLLVAARQANEAERLQVENRYLERKASRLGTPVSSSPDETRPSRETGETRPGKPGPVIEEALRQQIEMADRGMHEYHGDYFLMEEGLPGLSPKAAKAAGLTGEEETRVSGIMTKTWKAGAADFARRAELVEEESDEKTGRRVYMIPARVDRGWEIKDVLLAELGDAVGIDKRAILMRGYQSDHFFGGFGAEDVRLEFYPAERRFAFSYLNPLDGQASLFGEDPMEDFSRRFGDSFEIPGVSVPEK
jgi:hypothetical protein